MSKRFSTNLALNSLSFGQSSLMFLREYIQNYAEYSQKWDLNGLFPIGQPDLSAQSPEAQALIIPKINEYIQRGMETHNRKTDPCFKLWHLSSSLESFSEENLLLSFYELDSPTKYEINVAKNNKIAFSSKYCCDIFESYGAKPIHIPLAFDKYNFKQIDRKFADNRIVFNVVGKFEKRKAHAKVFKAWLRRFGRDNRYALQAAIYNPFLPNPEQQNQAICQALTNNERQHTTTFLGHMVQNSAYNDFLNSSNIVIAMSCGEGWALPEMTSVALGKHAVVLRAHAHLDWATPENSVLVDPNGKQPAADGFFFH